MTPRAFAVIHVLSVEQALYNASLAIEAGLHGVFLISHGAMHWRELLSCALLCRKTLAGRETPPFVGINFLDLSFRESVDIANTEANLTAVWTDQTPNEGWRRKHLELFGGAAFKHQPQPDDLPKATREAAQFCDVLTTSGVMTGKPPTVEKIQTMRQALNDAWPGQHKRLAIASGITPENVVEYLPYATDFLVATGIEQDWGNLDYHKAKRLADAVRAPRCEHCGGDLGGYSVGRIESHKPGCPVFPL